MKCECGGLLYPTIRYISNINSNLVELYLCTKCNSEYVNEINSLTKEKSLRKID